MARRQRKQRMTPRLLAFMLFLGIGAIAIIISILKSIVDYFKKTPDAGLIFLTVITICFVAYLLLKKINESSLEKAQIRELEAEEAKRLEEIKRAKEAEIKKTEDTRRKIEETKSAEEAKDKESYLISIIFDYENEDYQHYLSEFPWNKMRDVIENIYKNHNPIISLAEFSFKNKNKLRAEFIEHIFIPLYHYYRFEKKNDTINELVKTIEEGMRAQKIDEANSEKITNFLADNIFTIANHSYVLKVINDTKRAIMYKYYSLSAEDFKRIESDLKNLFCLLLKDEIHLNKELMSTIKEIAKYQHASKMLPEIKKMIDNKDMIGAKALYLSVYDGIDHNIYSNIRHNGFRVNQGWNLEKILGITYDELLRGQAVIRPSDKKMRTI